jgi:hypothetical protein
MCCCCYQPVCIVVSLYLIVVLFHFHRQEEEYCELSRGDRCTQNGASSLVSVLNHSTQMFDKLKDIQVQRNIDENALGLVNGARADAQPEEPDPTTLL